MDWNYEQLEQQLLTLGSGSTAAEVHATACGLLAASNNAPEQCLEPFIDSLQADNEQQAKEVAIEFLDQCSEALDAEEMTWEPLLPDDDYELVQRAGALGQWVQGFLFGLSSSQFQLLENLDNAEAKELVADFAEIAKVAHIDEQSAEDVHEESYAELVEYVRIGALYISELVVEYIRSQLPKTEPAPAH